MEQKNNLDELTEEESLLYIDLVYDKISTFEDVKNIYVFDTTYLDNKKKNKINKIINLNNMFKKISFNDYVYVKKSPIHGNGVFAKCNIKKNSIITLYPVDYICYKNNFGEKKVHYITEKMTDSIDDKKYMIGINDEIEIYGNKNNTSDNSRIGHIINDSTSFIIDNENIDDITLKNIICKYILNSNNNALLKSNNDKTMYYVIAIKDINEGDEILMSYTPKFWINNDKLYKRFKSLLINDMKFSQFFLKIGIQKICNTSSFLEALQLNI